jgi:hypothetical protein
MTLREVETEPAARWRERLTRAARPLRPRSVDRDATALTVVTVLLLLTGLVMSFSASFVDAAEAGDPFGVFRRQIVWALLGVPAFVAGRLRPPPALAPARLAAARGRSPGCCSSSCPASG